MEGFLNLREKLNKMILCFIGFQYFNQIFIYCRCYAQITLVPANVNSTVCLQYNLPSPQSFD